MLNKDGQRELAYVVYIDDIQPIEGKDRVECAVVGGWTIMVRKGQFQIGDPAIYFEIDSKVPETEPFEFLAQKHYKIKTQKYGKFYSQGLLMAAEDFGWEIGSAQFAGGFLYIVDDEGVQHYPGNECAFLTKKLGVTYYDPADNARKGSGIDKYKKMAGRHPKIFRNPIIKWIYKRDWGKKFLFIFFGKKKDNRNWPQWVVKTDEERIQNMPFILKDKCEWIATEKIDGTSTTFTMKRGKFGTNDFYVCSRNVVFDKSDKKCFYDTNVYVEMAEKYNIENVLAEILKKDKSLEFVTIQGETYGEGVQKRNYSLKGHDFMAFNLIFKRKNEAPVRLNPIQMTTFLAEYWIPCVPIVNQHFILPDTVEELLAYATDHSMVDGGMREGVVFRDYNGERSFKAVSNEFLMKYHNG